MYNISGILDEKISFVAANDGDPVEHQLSFSQVLNRGLVCSPLLCHHLIHAYTFMRMLGFDKKHLRFRQHLPQEMAHYASDCWDLEVSMRIAEGERDWVECIGIADRSAFDLSSHIQASGKDFRVFEKFDEPKMVPGLKLKPDMKRLGRQFRKDAGPISRILSGAGEDMLRSIKDYKERCQDPASSYVYISLKKEDVCLEESKGSIPVPLDYFQIEESVEKVTGRKYVPSVVEPSYGVGRIIYGLLNNAIQHKEKEGEAYSYFTLSPAVAPVVAGIFPLTKDERLVKLARRIHLNLKGLGVSTLYDGSGSVGRRYARMDEIGTPFCVTVDFDSLEDGAATLRFIDTRQYRVPVENIPALILERMRVF